MSKTVTIEVRVKSWDCIHGGASKALAHVDAYLPSNYQTVGVGRDGQTGDFLVTVEGKDDHGWTAEGYVIPRLATGLHTAQIINRKEN
jgi:hypothetical protein